MLRTSNASAVELSALRQEELIPLFEQLDDLELSGFGYVSFHAPSKMEASFEPIALKILDQIASIGWPIVVHPDTMSTPKEWACLGNRLCIENMDKRKPVGQTANDLAKIFEALPDASLCFDIGHARQVDPTMSEASAILRLFSGRIQQLHVSEVNTQSKHDSLTCESTLAFQKVAHLVPQGIPIILESRVAESEINEEIQNASGALSVHHLTAIVSD